MGRERRLLSNGLKLGSRPVNHDHPKLSHVCVYLPLLSPYFLYLVPEIGEDLGVVYQVLFPETETGVLLEAIVVNSHLCLELAFAKSHRNQGELC